MQDSKVSDLGWTISFFFIFFKISKITLKIYQKTFIWIQITFFRYNLFINWKQIHRISIWISIGYPRGDISCWISNCHIHKTSIGYAVLPGLTIIKMSEWLINLYSFFYRRRHAAKSSSSLMCRVFSLEIYGPLAFNLLE